MGVQSVLMFLQHIRKASCTISKYNARNLKKQVKFKDLPESFVIFITENDVIGDGEKIYHADRIIRETGKRFVGTGNIVGASGAILMGGPGAIFWMWVIAFL